MIVYDLRGILMPQIGLCCKLDGCLRGGGGGGREGEQKVTSVVLTTRRELRDKDWT